MFSRKLFVAVGLAATLTADLPSWISTIEVRTKLEEIFYTTVTFGANTLAWRKPPKETRPALSQQIQQAPADAQLYYLRAREAEAQLDFAAAEADWAKFTQIAPNRAQAWFDKADFHHRRAEPEGAGRHGGGDGIGGVVEAVDEVEDQGHHDDHDKERQHWRLSRA